MSAGTGIRHSEMNASATEQVHFIQMWVLPGRAGVPPSYEQRDINEALDAGGLVPIASGQGHEGAVSLNQRDAVLWGARLAAGEQVALGDAAQPGQRVRPQAAVSPPASAATSSAHLGDTLGEAMRR